MRLRQHPQRDRRAGDLAGRTIGEFGTYGQDSGVWADDVIAPDLLDMQVSGDVGNRNIY